MLSCKDVTSLASQACDRHLTWRERFGMRVHLLICRACQHVVVQFKFIHKAAQQYMQQYVQNAQHIRLSDAARQRIAHKLGRHH